MLKIFTKSVIACMILFNATAAYSQWYIGIGGGNASYTLPDEVNELGALVDNLNNMGGIPGIVASFDAQDSDTAIKVFAGTSISENLDVEVGYVDLGEISVDFSLIDDGSFTGDPSTTIISETDSVSGFSFAAVGSMPMSETVSLNGRLGIYMWQFDIDVSSQDTTGIFGNFSDSSSESGNDIFYGVGLDISWFSLFYEAYDIDGQDVDLIGAAVKFNLQ